MRQRVEDLGRLSVMIDNLVEDDFFRKYEERPKHFWDWFKVQTEDKQEEVIRFFAYGREEILESLYEMREIAMGEDRLNQKED